MLKIKENIIIDREISFLKELFSKIVTDDATLTTLDFNLFFVNIRNVNLLFDINYEQQIFGVNIPLKIRKKDERFFNYLCGYLQSKNVKINYM